MIPKGMNVLHRCDNPSCVRPKHLFIGTDTDNMRDMAAKGRGTYQARPDKVPRGEAHRNARLSDVIVEAARREYGAGAVRLDVLAARLEVSVSTLHAALYGRTWRHVAGALQMTPELERLIRSRAANERWSHL